MARALEIHPGELYGFWKIIKEVEPKRYGKSAAPYRHFRCLCTACGETVSDVVLGNLRNGNSKSCISCGNSRAAKAENRHHKMVVRGLIKQLPEFPDALLAELMEAATNEFRGRGVE